VARVTPTRLHFIPFQKPDGGPNFFEFGEDVLYEIHVSNRGTSRPDVTYEFRFHTEIRNNDTFLYNTGPIRSISDDTWNRPQYYTVTLKRRGHSPQVLGRNLPCPPVNVGPRSTPDYDNTFTDAAIHELPGDRWVFAGQRADGFHVDLGAVFDLGTLRPFTELHLVPSASAVNDPVNGLQALNVHSIAMQVPMPDVTRNRNRPDDVMAAESVIGVWATASRRRSRIFNSSTGKTEGNGPYVQVSRLANPLFNEVIVPMARKDEWNADKPHNDSYYASLVNRPELGRLLPFLYPNTFENLEDYNKPRADLNAILLTGIPPGVIDGFQNYTGPVEADMLRLNVAIEPTENPRRLGLLAANPDPAGFPNGRRVIDDVVTIELRAIAGVTIPLVDPSYEPDAAANAVTDGTTNTNENYRKGFPFLGAPAGGYQTLPGTEAEDS